ncbi:hypothetical protein BV61_07460 [Candidatus Synechococcus spongiarum LMB bulk15M]|uniref:Uncharacterized protein n=1 Tax=Candidatus Synechococcus spongiarum LMB bulk15M TaxID=1943582 RepID=A0A1T1C7S1_9SYNE|nr:hypothetical protein BV61_07460 [Candidatus Synechococcus spongiarum LMB bulk15M]
MKATDTALVGLQGGVWECPHHQATATAGTFRNWDDLCLLMDSLQLFNALQFFSEVPLHAFPPGPGIADIFPSSLLWHSWCSESLP